MPRCSSRCPCSTLDAQRPQREPASRPPPPTGPLRSERPRSIELRSQRIQYSLRRSRRRTIGFSVDEHGLSVSAPRWVGLAEIESALDERGDWILRKLVEFRELVERRERDAIRWEHGGTIPFLGRRIEIDVAASHRGTPLLDGRLARGLAARRSERTSRCATGCRAGCRHRRASTSPTRIAHFSRAARRRTLALGAVVGAHALGKLQRRRVDPAELAADPPARDTS